MIEKFTIAAFDFDDTITRKCTFVGIMVHLVGLDKFLLKMIKLLPDVILYKLGIMSNNDIKLRMFTRFFAGMKENEYKDFCKRYSEEVVSKIIAEKAKEKIDWHKTNGHKLVIITASMEDWVKPWADSNNFDAVLSTRPEIKEGFLTGEFENRNCFGEEKVKRLLEIYPNREDYVLYAYGDSDGDKALLEYADYPSFNFVEGRTG